MADDLPSFGMFAAVHGDAHRVDATPRAPVADGDSSTVSPPDGLPGAYAEGGRRSGQEADDTYTVIPEQSLAPTSERRDANENATMMIPIASVAVDDDDNRRNHSNVPVVEAEAKEEQEEVDWFSQRRNKFILGLILLLVVGITVTVVLLVTGDSGGGEAVDVENNDSSSSRQTIDDDTGSSQVQSDTTTPNPTPSPTETPSISPAPTSLFDRIFVLISTYSGAAVLEDSTTPQYQGLQWTLGDAEATEWTDETILERYALASLFYATRGGRWLSVTDFLLQQSYCIWQGVECTNGLITSLSLPSRILLVHCPERSDS